MHKRFEPSKLSQYNEKLSHNKEKVSHYYDLQNYFFTQLWRKRAAIETGFQ